MKDVHELSLVFMKTFYLNIEDGSRIDIDAVVLLDVLCKTDLVLVLNIHEFLLALLIIHINRKLFNIGEICDPLISDLVGHPVCKQRVAVKQETSLGNTVCFIIKLLRHHLIEVTKLLFLKDLCVKLRNTVYREAADDCKVSHADLSVVNDRHSADLLVVTRISLLDLGYKTAVDLLNDLVNTRKQTGEQLDRPFFKSLSHDGVVCVGTGLCRDLPGLIPL